MMGLDISSGRSLFEKRRKSDFFLKSGGGCEVSTASMVKMCSYVSKGTLVQAQANVGSECQPWRVSKKQRTEVEGWGSAAYQYISMRDQPSIQPAPHQGMRRLSLGTSS